MELRCEIGILDDEIGEVVEELGIAQRRRRNVAVEGRIVVPLLAAPDQLHTSEQQHVVDGAYQSGAFGNVDILARTDDIAVGIANARVALVEALAALRQADDRLQVDVDAVETQGLADDLEDMLLVEIILRRDRRGACLGQTAGDGNQLRTLPRHVHRRGGFGA